MKWFAPALLLLVAGTPQEPVQAPVAQRIGLALVIGNSKYSQDELPTVDTDRLLMAKSLESQGFRVREVENLEKPRDFEEALKSFLKSENAAPEDTLVVYYSGHGVQIEGKAYLVGTGITRSGDGSTLKEFSVNVDNLIWIMEQAAPSARVLIIDACRNNPFAAGARNAGPAFQRTVEDTYIIFANEPGKTVPARSDTSLQGPFTASLLYAFENSDAGLEERFKIAKEKTEQLNPDQKPQLLRSDTSAGRNRLWLDRGGPSPSAPTRSAETLLEQAEPFYYSRSWSAFKDKISAARVLSSEPALMERLDRELAFAEAVLAAIAAESDATGAKWADAARSWQKASTLFPSRAWVLEKAAIDWLLADQMKEAVDGLARLKAFTGPAAERGALLLADLLRHDPALEAVVKTVPQTPGPAGGPEFEKFTRKQ